MLSAWVLPSTWTDSSLAKDTDDAVVQAGAILHPHLQQ